MRPDKIKTSNSPAKFVWELVNLQDLQMNYETLTENRFFEGANSMIGPAAYIAPVILAVLLMPVVDILIKMRSMMRR